jgi:hypothetical protein
MRYYFAKVKGQVNNRCDFFWIFGLGALFLECMDEILKGFASFLIRLEKFNAHLMLSLSIGAGVHRTSFDIDQIFL